MKHINEKPHKIAGNQVIYLNGNKWLVRETLKTNKEAKEKLKELCPHQIWL